MNHNLFGLIVIGDEILVGQRKDRHFTHFKSMFSARGLCLNQTWFLPDDKETLIRHLRFSFSLDLAVFVCGGIGATPDDLTRDCAAEAAGVTLERSFNGVMQQHIQGARPWMNPSLLIVQTSRKLRAPLDAASHSLRWGTSM